MPDDNEPPSPPALERLSARDAADFLGITTGRLERLRKDSKIPAIRDGWFSHRYAREDLMAYAERAAAEAAGRDATGSPVPQLSENDSVNATPEDPRAYNARQLNEIIATNFAPKEPEDDGEAVADEAPIVRMAYAILATAIDKGASDIHIEPDRRNVRIRIRVDGLMAELMALPKNVQTPLLNRFKMMAELNPFAARAQTGHFGVKHDRRDFDLRVSTVPSLCGETITLRIYEHARALGGLNRLGFFTEDQAVVEEQVLLPGLFLMVGPKASGTTTTGYALLNKVNSLHWNTISFEQEHSYRLSGVTQVYADARRGRTLAETLPFLLHQNPDTLFLGDIDGPESAALVVNAAEQGVRVWATLHAPDAVRALFRLKHLGIAPERVGGVLNAVCAQRLARRICEGCKTEREAEKREIRPFVAPKTDNLPDSLFLYHGTGCDACDHKGYRGQVGIFEILRMTEELRFLYAENATPGKLTDAAERGGMTPLRYDLGQKIYTGMTTPEEGRRVL